MWQDVSIHSLQGRFVSQTDGSKRRDSYLRRTYGLGLEDYNRILEDQGGGCAVCGKTPEEEGRNLAVDHDHDTGAVRGILCTACNHRLVGRHRRGLESHVRLRSAADYLDREYYPFVVPPKKKRKRKSRK